MVVLLLVLVLVVAIAVPSMLNPELTDMQLLGQYGWYYGLIAGLACGLAWLQNKGD